MVRIKEMPYSEKYAQALEYTKLLEGFVLPLVQKRLGDKALAQLQGIWREEAKAIPADVSDQEKYEIAYGSWLRQWGRAFGLVRNQLGEDGVEEFMAADVDALKRKNSGPALYLLRAIRALSRSSAFYVTAGRMAYQLQFFTPFSVSELNGSKAVFNIPRCKILDSPDGETVCQVGCQGVFPIWMADQLKVKMDTDRQGNNCTVTLSPL